MSYEVVKAHAPEPGTALAVARGARLRWQRRSTAWRGWLYCEDASGVRGWVPEAWLTLDGDEATIDRDYDATELDVRAGDVLEQRISESGWILARDAAGRLGWVPLECLRVLT